MTPADTSVVVALIRGRDDRHTVVREWYATHLSPLVTTPLVLAEIDYMLRRHASHRLADAFYAQVESGGLGVTWWPDALAASLEITRGRPDAGLADASLVALAAHLGTTTIATLDERHFRSLQPLTGEGAFTLLPADAD